MRVDFQGVFLWDSTYVGTDDAVAYSICMTSDCGYALAGVRGYAPSKPYVLRTDAAGHLLWEKTLEVGGNFSWASQIKQTPDGGYIITGSHHGSVAELFLTKLLAGGSR